MVLSVPKDADPVSLVPPVPLVPLVEEPLAVGEVAPVLLVLLSSDAVSPLLESPVALPESAIEVDCVAVVTELVVFALVVLLTPADDPVPVDCCAPTALSDVPASELA